MSRTTKTDGGGGGEEPAGIRSIGPIDTTEQFYKSVIRASRYLRIRGYKKGEVGEV